MKTLYPFAFSRNGTICFKQNLFFALSQYAECDTGGLSWKYDFSEG